MAAKVLVIPEERKPACAYRTIAELVESERQQQDRWVWPEELPVFTKKAATIGADAIWIQPGRVRDLGQVREGNRDNYVRTRMVINYALALKVERGVSVARGGASVSESHRARQRGRRGAAPRPNADSVAGDRKSDC